MAPAPQLVAPRVARALPRVVAALVVLAVSGGAGALVRAWLLAEQRIDDRRAAALVAASVEVRVAALAAALRGPASAFELDGLQSNERQGVLRLAYSQARGVTAVALLDATGAPAAPAVYLSRGGDAHASAGLEDLRLFGTRVPFERAVRSGRAASGLYRTVRGDGARVVFAEALPVARGAETWVLAAEVDVELLLEGLAGVYDDGGARAHLALLGPEASARPAGSDAVWSALHAQLGGAPSLRAPAREPRVLRGAQWRAVVTAAPAGLGVLALVWVGGDGRGARALAAAGAVGLLLLVLCGVGAALALRAIERSGEQAHARGIEEGLARREPSDPTADARPSMDPRASIEVPQVLGSVLKELANPVSAAAGAASLLAALGAKASEQPRAVEAMVRAVRRLERSYRRIARLARPAEERPRSWVALEPAVRAALEPMLAELGPNAAALRVEADAVGAERAVFANAEDVALLVQALVDGARAVAPGDAPVRVLVGPGFLRVTDGAALARSERAALLEVADGLRTGGAASTLSWTLAAQIAGENDAVLEADDDGFCVRWGAASPELTGEG